MARSFGCAPSTVTRLSARLGRHALLLSARALDSLGGRLSEPLVIDHFETFEFSQDLPFGIGTAVGSRSWFLYAIDPAPHRRGGRLSPAQRRRLRRRPVRPLRGGYLGSARRILQQIVDLSPPDGAVHLIGDGHRAYSVAVATHRRRGLIQLRQYSNPRRGPKGSARTRLARARDRAMFPVDALHALLRHSLSHHRRETIAFSRRLNAAMERMFLAAVWRNFIKGRSERQPDPATPGMVLGLASAPWTWPQALARRLFPSRETLPPIWQLLYRRDWATPVLRFNTTHRLRYAY